MSKPDPVTEAAPIDDEARAKEIARVAVLRVVVTVLGAILVVLAIVVFSTLILRAVKGDDKAAPRATQPPASANPAAGLAASVQPALPAGARVVSTALGDGRLSVTVEADGEIVIILFDAATLAETGRIRLPRP